MTIKEKRTAGLLYRPFEDKELSEEYARASRLLSKFNALGYDDRVARAAILKELLGSIGRDCTIVSPFHCDFGYNIHVGNHLWANVNLVIIDCASVEIGNNVLIGPNVGLYTAGHPENSELRAQGFEYARPIKIGSDVWIGGHACILPGVTVGDNVIIGAGSVVTRDIPSGYVAVGNPCRVIRRTGDERRP